MQDESTRRRDARFWRHVDKTGPVPAHLPDLGPCWLWIGSRLPSGYGRVQSGAPGRWRCEYAHRMAWQVTYGPVPASQWVLHRCDNPPCVNPAHLFLGDAKTNAQDRNAKGRAWYQGQPTPWQEHVVRYLRAVRTQRGMTQETLSATAGIHLNTISAIETGKAQPSLTTLRKLAAVLPDLAHA
jgi:DNA-binding XRE family transcriptional regulator